MNDKLNQIFKNVSQIEPPKSLGDSIFRRIEREKDKKIKIKLVLSYVGLLGSCLLIFWPILAFGNSFLRSEFWSLLSLIFSDAMIIAGNWKEYLYSLMETFPVVMAIVVLIPIFIFLLFFNLLVSFREKHRAIHSHLKFV